MSSEKGDSACHVSENVQPVDLGGILKQTKNYKDGIWQKKFTGGKIKS